MPNLAPIDAALPTEPAVGERTFEGGDAEAAAYIEELLDELADLAEAAGHRRLSHTILVAALEAAGIAARAGGRPVLGADQSAGQQLGAAR